MLEETIDLAVNDQVSKKPNKNLLRREGIVGPGRRVKGSCCSFVIRLNEPKDAKYSISGVGCTRFRREAQYVVQVAGRECLLGNVLKPRCTSCIPIPRRGSGL